MSDSIFMSDSMYIFYVRFYVYILFVCLFGSLRRINPCGSLASGGIKLNMMKMEKVKIYRIKGKMIMSLYNDN